MAETSRSEWWGKVVAAHSQGLFRLAVQMLGDRLEAQDVVQETYLRAYVAMERRGLEVHTSTKAWLARIAINLCYDRLRKKSWHEMPAGHGSDLAIASPSGSDPCFEWLSAHAESPEAAVLRSDQSDRLRASISSLPPNHRAAVVLRYAYDLSYREIAQVMEVPENTVATWLRRAHLALRRELQGELELESEKQGGVPCPVTARA